MLDKILKETLDDFIAKKENQKAFTSIKEYSAQNCLVLLDSEFVRKNIARRYSIRIPFWSGTIEKENYSFVGRIDQTNKNYTGRQVLENFNKPLIITGIGLFGDLFIRDLRAFEKANQKEFPYKCPIVIFGSPSEYKIENLRKYIDLFIDNRSLEAIFKLDWFLNHIFIS